MRKLWLGIVVSIVVLAAPALALDLQGRWQFQREGYNGTYSGVMVIDPGGQVRLKGRGPTQAHSECGYVQVVGDKIDVVFTAAFAERGYSPDHFYCRSNDASSLTCFNVDAAGQSSNKGFILTRTGPVPGSAAERLEDACSAQPKPRS